MTFAWPVLVYHLALLMFLVSLSVAAAFPGAVVVAFVPAILRASGLAVHLGRKFPIRRLGWTEVAHSLLFAVLLILSFKR